MRYTADGTRRHPSLFGVVMVVAMVLAGAGGARAVQDDATPVEALLGDYVGSWQAEQRSTPDGRDFRFAYRLEWFDRGRQILKMTIAQEFADGETRLLFEGFKGWDRRSEQIYYWAVSPSGRRAIGEVVRDGDEVQTNYDGIAPDGTRVEIRDVFHPVNADAFLSVTWMLRDGEWVEFNRDHWERDSR